VLPAVTGPAFGRPLFKALGEFLLLAGSRQWALQSNNPWLNGSFRARAKFSLRKLQHVMSTCHGEAISVFLI